MSPLAPISGAGDPTAGTQLVFFSVWVSRTAARCNRHSSTRWLEPRGLGEAWIARTPQSLYRKIWTRHRVGQDSRLSRERIYKALLHLSFPRETSGFDWCQHKTLGQLSRKCWKQLWIDLYWNLGLDESHRGFGLLILHQQMAGSHRLRRSTKLGPAAARRLTQGGSSLRQRAEFEMRRGHSQRQRRAAIRPTRVN